MARNATDNRGGGSGLPIASGTAILSSGTVAVSDTKVTANSVISLRYITAGGTPGALYVSARSAGTSFTVTSTSNTDTSTIGYDISSY